MKIVKRVHTEANFVSKPWLLNVALLCLLTSVIGPTRLIGQASSIAGVVVDSTGSPLPGVNIVVDGLGRGAASGTDGSFRLPNLPPGEYRLTFSAVGFEKHGQNVTLTGEEDVWLEVALRDISFLAHEIVVTASRKAQLSSSVPASFDLITPRDLVARNVVTLDQALRQVPGVQVMENQVNIRGSSGYAYNVGSRVLLLLDGLPLLTPDSDGVPFDALPFNMIEQIEVVKGPGSALWGSGALGGIIHVLTKDYPKKPESTLKLYTGVHEPVGVEEWLDKWPDGRDPRPFWGTSISHARMVGSKFGFWINADFRDDRGYANMKTERFGQLYAKVGWKPSGSSRLDVLVFGLSRRKENFLFWNGEDDALNPGIPTVGNSDDVRASTDVRTDQLTIAPSLRQVISDQILLQVKLRAFGTRIEGIGDDEIPSGDVTHGFRYGGEAQLDWSPGGIRGLVVGVSGDANTTESPFFVTDEGVLIGNQPETAVFAQYEDVFLSAVGLVAGLRYSTYAVTTLETVTRLTPKIALSHTFGNGATLHASFGQGFRVPSLAERFIDDRDYVPLYPNFTLRPEESTSLEIGMRWDSRLTGQTTFRFDMAAFFNEYEGLIEPKLVRISPPGEEIVVGFRFVNLRQARIVGVDASVKIGFAGAGSVHAGYTYMYSEDLDEELPLPFRPEHLVIAGLQSSVPGPFEVGADFRLASTPERLDSDFALFVPDSDVWFATRSLDAWAALVTGPIRLSVHARNAFDHYFSERPAFLGAPRHYLAELRVDL